MTSKPGGIPARSGSGSRVLVTGCNGYIGRHLVPAVEAAGHTVVGLDRSLPEHAPAHFHHGDLRDEDLVARALEGVEVVVHLAAAKDDWGLSERDYYADNVEATRVLLAAGRKSGVRDWVFYSTVSVFGPSEHPVDEEAPRRPINPYGRSKAAAEELFTELASELEDSSVLIIRPSVVFGPGHPPITNVSRLIEGLRRRRFLMVGKGEALKTTSYIENLVAATTFLLERRRRGVQGFIYVDEPLLSTGQLVLEISKRLERPAPRRHIPIALGMLPAAAGSAIAAITRRNFPITVDRVKKFNTGTAFSASKLRGEGFDQPVTLEDALDRTVAWHTNP